ncbi:MAG: hypothetical protein L3J08_03280 [Flavobacteriaceae bacterium]|nr:hypothetical protein [Flavobacteriaceae bacterium]
MLSLLLMPYTLFSQETATTTLNVSPKIDTITTFKKSRKVKLNHAIINGQANVFFEGFGLISFKADSVPSWQNDFRFERTKINKLTTYKQIDIPFQIRDYKIIKTSPNSIVITVFTTKQCKISYYINGVKNKASSNDFNAIKLNNLEYKHTQTLKECDPNSTYDLLIEVVAKTGEFNMKNISCKAK